ncbi:MAG: oxygen-independent coproporphyrinogen III oxidase [Verrucomicrobiales bacterium]|nr:oxygen-independent coproporphyrinogen III oxidase [Verrucomicrobiales bacterium]MCP5525609.1 oxygen-independent coproporphyrinogen III oxidase [Verrucomicrobiales bacterium]
MSKLNVDFDLVRKYNVPGPRYTSYPPATQFSDQLPLETVRQRIEANNATPRDLSLYFHLPFCETLCWFCGCTTVITLDHGKSRSYVGRLEQEMDLVRPLLHPERQVVQIHFGGGTPTFSPPDQLRRLGEAIHRRFPFAADVEAGVEVDPRRLTRDHLVALREIGFNRTSMGVQDNNPVVQKAVHRIQPLDLTRQTVDWIRELGFTSLNIDLIYGLPHQTVDSFRQTLDEIIELQPDRFAVFSYAHVPWMKPAQKILQNRDVLPSAETKLDLLKLSIERLGEAGYVYIGMDHFARPDDELAVAQKQGALQRNFQGYSTRGGADIYSFGMSSISQIEDTYWQNLKELPAYEAAIDAGHLPYARGYQLTRDDLIRRETIMQIMCNLGADYAAMSQRLGVPFEEYFAAELASLDDLEADGLVVRQATGLRLTELGRLLVRIVAMRFDVYLPKQTVRRHAMTI